MVDAFPTKRTSRKLRALLISTAAPLIPMLSNATPAHAVTDPNQPVLNDYGQSPAEVAAEISAAVAATPSVIAARAAYSAAKAAVVADYAAERRALTAYVRAVRSGTRTAAQLTALRKAWYAAHNKTVAARVLAARRHTQLVQLVTRLTAAVRAQHYLPVDGSYLGDVSQYFIPSIGLEPIQVGITVYGGHVTDISVPQYASTGDSASYNEMALPILMNEAMAALDTANVATVSGATLTSESFINSLTSALTKAGFKP